jgi:hypothetical protein
VAGLDGRGTGWINPTVADVVKARDSRGRGECGGPSFRTWQELTRGCEGSSFRTWTIDQEISRGTPRGSSTQARSGHRVDEQASTNNYLEGISGPTEREQNNTRDQARRDNQAYKVRRVSR